MKRKRKFPNTINSPIHFGDPLKRTASEDSIKSLHDQCFYVWPGKFDLEAIQILHEGLTSVGKAKWMPIFNPNRKRLQYILENTNYSLLKEATEFMKSVNPNLEPKVWAALKTIQGAKRQKAHLDYAPNNIYKLTDDQIPLLLLIPLEDNVSLHLWNPSKSIIRGTYNCVKVKSSFLTANRGDLIVFRADLIHAGSEWMDGEKLRIHCYFHNNKISFPDDYTWQIDKNENSDFGFIANIIDQEL